MLSGSEERSDSSDSASFYSVIEKDSKFGSFHSIYSVEYHKRESPHCSDRSVFHDCVDSKESKKDIIANSEISLSSIPRSTVNVIMSDNSGSKPKDNTDLSKESVKKKKNLFSFKKKGSKKDRSGHTGTKTSGTDSDLSSSNSGTPQLTPQGTLEKNVEPWKNEISEQIGSETSKFNQVSGKEKQKRVTSFLSLKKGKNIKPPLVQITNLSKLEIESGETRSENLKKLTPEKSPSEASDDLTVPDRKLVIQEDITQIPSGIIEFSHAASGIHEFPEGENLAPDTRYTSFHTSQNERFHSVKDLENIDIAEGPSKPRKSNLEEKSKTVTSPIEQLRSIAQEIAEVEKVNEIKPFDDPAAVSSSTSKNDKLSTARSEDTKEPVVKPEAEMKPFSLLGSSKEPVSSVDEVTTRKKDALITKDKSFSTTTKNLQEPVVQPAVEIRPSKLSDPSKDSIPSIDEVTTRKKVTLVTISGKTKETDSFDSISSYPRIGTKVKSSSLAKVKSNPIISNEITNKNADRLKISSVTLNQKRKMVAVDSLVKAELPKINESPVRVPQKLTNEHFAPFGKAIIKPKIPNDQTFSRSISNEISETDGDNKGYLSYSNLYVNATETNETNEKNETDEGSSASGQLSDSWAFSSSDKKEHLYKILVIGELGTGKTSIIKRYVHQFFCQHYRATIGVDFALKVLNWDENTVIRLQLWDIAGQERFGNMTRVYYKQAVGAFIVFDVSNGKTFDAVTKWKNDLDSKVTLPDGTNIPAVLLANKCDQPKDGVVSNPNKMDDYCRERKFAGWFETSAKEDINIDEATKFLISKILNNEKEGLMVEDFVDKDKFSIESEVKEESEEKKCLC
ncbi:Ras-related protein Rab-32 [Armadillidium nasatum]|uniref:Ras-related protein Rab-32 n=1 Tax=Armadillidium nasatum TaxID=96803 RepID=A0A5N5TPL7_9CRUS|nr:Ras-related protein Rab-32 [Armadillidium nasatum]